MTCQQQRRSMLYASIVSIASPCDFAESRVMYSKDTFMYGPYVDDQIVRQGFNIVQLECLGSLGM